MNTSTKMDWRVNANANQGYSLGGPDFSTFRQVVANYWLNHVYPPEVGVAHREGDIHVHDLACWPVICAGWSLRTLLNEGLNGVPGKVEAGPPNTCPPQSARSSIFSARCRTNGPGAQAFSSFDTYMGAFIRKDNLKYDDVRQSIQEMVYNLNVPSRWGTQTPFTNLTFGLGVPGGICAARHR